MRHSRHKVSRQIVVSAAGENLFDTTDEIAPDYNNRCFLATDEPTTFAEAEKDHGWQAAMVEEMSSIEENKTWRICDLSPGHHAIGLKWVYKLKRGAGGAVVKRRTCLMAKGYMQR